MRDEDLARDETTQADPALPDDVGFSFVSATVRTLAAGGLLDLQCDCDSCLLRLSLALWEQLTPFRPVLAA